jgi:hypothetical protein
MNFTNTNDDALVANRGLVNRRKSRICMLTVREVLHEAFRCAIYESQDVLLDIDDVDLIHIRSGKFYKLRESQKRAIWHDFTKRMITANIAFEKVRLKEEYELFIIYCQGLTDLVDMSAIRGWKDRCRTSLCWIDELWAANVPKAKYWLSALKEFDHVVVGLSGTVRVLSEAIEKPCHFVPGAVDTVRFSPYPKPPARTIDIYSIGRIWEGLHQAFLDVSAKNGIFYVYDTFNASDTKVKNHRQHRELLANMAKRSKYFFVAPAKMNVTEETKGQVEVGFRYYEGSAAGAIMLGEVPDCESFHTMFDWPEVVVEIKPNGSDVANVLASLAAQPDRLLEISRRNSMEALLRHDWVYRWKQILNIAGLKPTPEMEIREKRLKQMAEQIGNGR